MAIPGRHPATGDATPAPRYSGTMRTALRVVVNELPARFPKFGRPAGESSSCSMLISGDRRMDRENVDPAVNKLIVVGKATTGNRKSGGKGGQGQKE